MTLYTIAALFVAGGVAAVCATAAAIRQEGRRHPGSALGDAALFTAIFVSTGIGGYILAVAS